MSDAAAADAARRDAALAEYKVSTLYLGLLLAGLHLFSTTSYSRRNVWPFQKLAKWICGGRGCDRSYTTVVSVIRYHGSDSAPQMSLAASTEPFIRQFGVCCTNILASCQSHYVAISPD